jgi:hypothetical protein
VPIDTSRLARTFNILAHTPSLVHQPPNTSFYAKKTGRQPDFWKNPEKFSFFCIFWPFGPFLTYFFSSAVVVAVFSLEGGQPKKPGLARTVGGFGVAGIQKTAVAFRVIIWENRGQSVVDNDGRCRLVSFQ